MSVRSNISRQLKSLKTTLKKHGKIFTKAMRINNIIADLKGEDIAMWTQRWRQEGMNHGNLSAYLRKKKKTVSNAEYRRRAEAQLEEEEREIRWRAIVDRANAMLRARARTYAPGVEIRLTQEDLSIEQIEEIADINDRIDAYSERAARAPIILEEILAQADRDHEDMMERIESERQGEPTAIAYENYYSDEGWGKKKRRKSRIRKFRSKYKTRKSNR